MRATVLLPLVAAASLALAGCDFEDIGGFERYHEDFHYSYPLKSGGRVSVEGFNGSIEISPWDQETVDISGTKSARSAEDAAAIRIDIDHQPDAVTVRAVRPSMRNGNYAVRYAIKVPRRAVYDHLTTSNGAIRVVEGAGPARLRTSNGRIEVDRLRGELHAETSNSAIEVLDNEGGVEAHTSNGHIRVEGLRGALDATTSNSSIHALIGRAGDSVRAHSSNGSIELTLPPGTQCPIRAQTSNSSITLHLPGDINANLSATTSNSSITSDFEMRMRGDISKHHLEGALGSGGPLIDVSTSNGAIRIVR
ncbi:MAG TPA: hypothetical protein VMH28_02775 [Candidatus Acidoferrales bacterium]|nr:hypothetical protein [Candidatus Acidoferrales bacterium]